MQKLLWREEKDIVSTEMKSHWIMMLDYKIKVKVDIEEEADLRERIRDLLQEEENLLVVPLDLHEDDYSLHFRTFHGWK